MRAPRDGGRGRTTCQAATGLFPLLNLNVLHGDDCTCTDVSTLSTHASTIHADPEAPPSAEEDAGRRRLRLPDRVFEGDGARTDSLLGTHVGLIAGGLIAGVHLDDPQTRCHAVSFMLTCSS